MEKTIAINANETLRLQEKRYSYTLQYKKELNNFWVWADAQITCEEWIAAKWILDNDMFVGENYPTIDEIREKQNK